MRIGECAAESAQVHAILSTTTEEHINIYTHDVVCSGVRVLFFLVDEPRTKDNENVLNDAAIRVQ